MQIKFHPAQKLISEFWLKEQHANWLKTKNKKKNQNLSLSLFPVSPRDVVVVISLSLALLCQGGTHCGFQQIITHLLLVLRTLQLLLKVMAQCFSSLDRYDTCRCNPISFLCILIPGVFPGFQSCFLVYRSCWTRPRFHPWSCDCERECLCTRTIQGPC